MCELHGYLIGVINHMRKILSIILVIIAMFAFPLQAASIDVNKESNRARVVLKQFFNDKVSSQATNIYRNALKKCLGESGRRIGKTVYDGCVSTTVLDSLGSKNSSAQLVAAFHYGSVRQNISKASDWYKRIYENPSSSAKLKEYAKKNM